MWIGKTSKLAASLLSILLLGGLTAGAAEAACNQADLTGNWVLHGFGYDGEVSNTIRCPIKVKAAGKVAAGGRCTGTTVNAQGEFESGSSTLAAGRALKVKSDCKVTGGLKLKVNREETQNAITFKLIGTSVITIESAQLSRDKEIVTGTAKEVFNGELTSEQLPEPIPQSSKSVAYFTLNKK